MARAGLKKVIKTVKGKKGSARRAYWVKSDPNAGKKKPGFLRRHAGKILGAAALAGLAYAAHKSGVAGAARSGVRGAREAWHKEALAQKTGAKSSSIMDRVRAAKDTGADSARTHLNTHRDSLRTQAVRHTQDADKHRAEAARHASQMGMAHANPITSIFSGYHAIQKRRHEKKAIRATKKARSSSFWAGG